jgi:hypothetical protein
MLLFAASCRFNAQNLRITPTKNNNYFFPHKEEKRKKEEKKDMQVQKQWNGGCQGFWEKNAEQKNDSLNYFNESF